MLVRQFLIEGALMMHPTPHTVMQVCTLKENFFEHEAPNPAIEICIVTRERYVTAGMQSTLSS